jgi:hypothetical protein
MHGLSTMPRTFWGDRGLYRSATGPTSCASGSTKFSATRNSARSNQTAREPVLAKTGVSLGFASIRLKNMDIRPCGLAITSRAGYAERCLGGLTNHQGAPTQESGHLFCVGSSPVDCVHCPRNPRLRLQATFFAHLAVRFHLSNNHVMVCAAGTHKFLMGSTLDDAPFIH